MTDYLGTDLAFVGDLVVDESGDLALETGEDCLLTDLRARLSTWRGTYFRWPEDGMDWAQWHQAESDRTTRAALAQELVREVEKDPRVVPGSGRAQVQSWTLERVTVALQLVAIEAGHPLNLVVGYDLGALTVEVIRGD